ncbi:hypothetical protein [Undibacterium sp.]|uniref:hypothetical protein n=1 Tax=Undibacterium sp. TaxID=1914977 RepID=UPI00374CB2B6
MKWIKASLLVLVALGSVTASSAWADHGHFGGYRGGFHGGYHGYGGPRVGLGLYLDPFPLFYGPAYYGPAYYPSYSEVVVGPAPTTVYVQPSATISGPSYPDNAGGSQPGQSSDWYYCHKPDGYYPSVKTCPSGWQRVPQTPADAPR